MKKILFLVIVIWTSNAFGQTQSGLTADKSIEYDSTLKVIYADTVNRFKNHAIYINGEFVNVSLMPFINTNLIKSINLINDTITIDNTLYKFKIHITTKNKYIPHLIALEELKKKYTNFRNESTLFMIDDHLIKSDYKHWLIDEKYISSIIIDKVEIAKDGTSLGLIKVRTKSKKNIEDLNSIYFR